MARARNLKPGFFKNEDLAECSFEARLCFAGLWTLADREGRMEDRPKRIKGELFAFDSVDVESLLAELAQYRFILRYEVDGLRLIQILKFSDHQNPHHREPESELPPPQSPGLKPVAKPAEPEAGPRLDPPSDDLEGGSNRAESGNWVSESGTLIPSSGATPPSAAVAARVDLVTRFKAVGIMPGSTPQLDAMVTAGITWDEIEPLLPQATGKRNAIAYIAAAVSDQRQRAAATVIAAKPSAANTSTNPDVAATAKRLADEAARTVAKPPADLLARRNARHAGEPS
jgi:hypothetical protein